MLVDFTHVKNIFVVCGRTALGRMPWIALGVSSSWALYGVFKKRLGIDPWVSNALEASLMLPFAIAYLFYLDANGVGAFVAGGTYITILLISVGLVTSVPIDRKSVV